MLPSEVALLTGQWPVNAEEPENAATTLAKSVVEGSFAVALSSSSAFLRVPEEQDINKPFVSWIKFVTSNEDRDTELTRLSLAVACLNAFVQVNWTGPDLTTHPSQVLGLEARISEAELNRIAVSELAYGGEPAYHLAQDAAFLRLAQILLDFPFKHCSSAPWWRLRACLVHQQVLDEATAPPPSILAETDALLPTISDQDLSGRLLLEQGLLEHHCSNDRSAAEHFIRAARVSGLQYELTGALGKRTKWQQMDITQLVLLAESRPRADDAPQTMNISSSEPVPDTLALNDDTLLEHTEFTSSESGGAKLAHLDPGAQPALHPLDQCLLLSLCLNVRNTSPADGLTQVQMTPYVARVISHPRNWSVHTMALLLRARLESGRTRTIERSVMQLQALVEQMPTNDSPVTERLMYVHDIPLPSKWEMERELARRFLELGVVRSALEIFERLEMWEEVVKCWQAMERRDKAVTIVRDLLEGRKAEADIVLAQGKEHDQARRHAIDAAREAKLWCLLGDLEPEHAEEHYQHAWRVSGDSSGRAMRSLGGYHFARGNFKQAVEYLRRAVKISPLLSRSWFILGCACVREEDWEGAREAFTRCVAIDDEDAESWNNLASVYLQLGEAGQKVEVADGAEDENAAELVSAVKDVSITSNDESKSVPFSNKMLAFRALQQGVKRSYDNWRMWMNYMVVAVDVGELAEAARALGRIIEERSSRTEHNRGDGETSTSSGAEAFVDLDVLERLVDAVTRAPSDPDDAVEGAGTAADAALNPNEGHGLSKRVLDLFDRVILPRAAAPRIFRAYARLLRWQGRWADALKAHMDAYRGGVAGTMEKGETDVARWREAVGEVEEIVDVLRNFGPRADADGRWRGQARSVVRTFMGRTRDFEDEPEWTRLVELQEELKKESD